MFAKIWAPFFDEDVTAWVKTAYSQKSKYKDRPFSDHDAQFYFKGIDELSHAFTENRGDQFRSQQPRYFEHPRFRSSYLLYFLPLQCAKFSALFKKRTFELKQSIARAKKADRPLAVYDMGSGPGTASLAFLLFLADEIEREKLKVEDLPAIRFSWYDSNPGVLKDGIELFKRCLKRAKMPESLFSLETHVGPWVQAERELMKNDPANADGARVFLFGNVLNESERKKSASVNEILTKWLNSEIESHAIFIEPAAKSTSQMLSQLRDDLLENERRSPQVRIVGPCLHAERCPLAQGRDWCHFSDAASVPGRWFLAFSKMLGSERKYLKYSMLWLATSKDTAPQNFEHKRLVLSDAMTSRSGDTAYLVCEPNEPRKIHFQSPKQLHRGDLLDLRTFKAEPAKKGSPAGSLSGASGSKVGYVKKK